MTQSKYERLPHAGDFERELGTEVFYLAPRPVPTGVAAFSSRSLHKESNEVFMDFATGSATLEFGVRCWIGSVMSMVMSLFLVAFGLGVVDHIKYGDPVFEILLTLALPNWYAWSFIGFLVLMYGTIFLRTVYQLTAYPPIRFNRQRREVVYVAKRGQPPRFVPWEEVIACVSSGTVATQYGVSNSFSLMIGLRDAASGEVTWLTIPTAALSLAVSEWEAIRAYMEEGPQALPKPLSEEFEEGTEAFFHLCRRGYRDDHSYVRYVFGFLLIQFCSGWTLPCRVAAWVDTLPKTSFPKAVLDWSQALPPEQWKTPSAALTEQSREIRKGFAKGRTLLDHFGVTVTQE